MLLNLMQQTSSTEMKTNKINYRKQREIRHYQNDKLYVQVELG